MINLQKSKVNIFDPGSGQTKVYKYWTKKYTKKTVYFRFERVDKQMEYVKFNLRVPTSMGTMYFKIQFRLQWDTYAITIITISTYRILRKKEGDKSFSYTNFFPFNPKQFLQNMFIVTPFLRKQNLFVTLTSLKVFEKVTVTQAIKVRLLHIIIEIKQSKLTRSQTQHKSGSLSRLTPKSLSKDEITVRN